MLQVFSPEDASLLQASRPKRLPMTQQIEQAELSGYSCQQNAAGFHPDVPEFGFGAAASFSPQPSELQKAAKRDQKISQPSRRDADVIASEGQCQLECEAVDVEATVQYLG